MAKNVLYAQSGGMTSVINATALGVIEAARASDRMGRVLAARDGIIGVLDEALVDVDAEDPDTLAALRHTPGGAFGACRFDIGTPEDSPEQYERLVEVFCAHDIGYFFYNGGGGSMLTAQKVASIGERLGHPVTCIGLPKTIDNDLPMTDNSPGFGSTAKFIATAVREIECDLRSMATTSTKVFVLEVMGRHAGWIAAASALAAQREGDGPHLILFAERAFDRADFIRRVREAVDTHGYCMVVASEGLRCPSGAFFSVEQDSEVYGWEQLGGVAPKLVDIVERELGYKTHWAVPDYMQRAGSHLASATDVEQAYMLGRRAVEMALAGRNAVMPVIRRLGDEPYRWTIDAVDLANVADVEVPVPDTFITDDGYGVTEAGLRYLRPLVRGEAAPPYVDGLPEYARLEMVPVEKKLPPFDIGEPHA